MADPLLQEAKRLHQSGRLAEAANLYQRVLRAHPGHTEALYGLGMAYAQTGRLDEGERFVGDALRSSPQFAEGWRARGVMLVHLGRRDEAHLCFDRALALKPDFKEAESCRDALLAEMVPAVEMLGTLERKLESRQDDAAGWSRHGSVLVSMGRLNEALASFERALSIDPEHAEALCNRATLLFETNRLEASLASFEILVAKAPGLAIGWNNRGNTLMKMNRFEEAVTSYDRALAIQPGFPEAEDNRTFALFQLGRTLRSPPKYMRGLFDEFSSHYDDTMLGKLDYRGHFCVRAIAERVLPNLTPPACILDLGCGTGLVGVAFKDLASRGRLDGVDIAPRMLEAARARGIYNDLILGDIELVLSALDVSYDLILSADTMTYFGDLSTVFSGVSKRLRPGCFYLFASEAKIGEGWEQTKVHRYRHSEAYLRAEAARAGLEWVDIMECVLRLEENVPVAGFAVALRKTA